MLKVTDGGFSGRGTNFFKCCAIRSAGLKEICCVWKHRVLFLNSSIIMSNLVLRPLLLQLFTLMQAAVSLSEAYVVKKESGESHASYYTCA
jgi:hypothetical protein